MGRPVYARLNSGPGERTAPREAGQRSPRVDPTRIDVVVVGAASRDIAPDDPRGWRLGGAVTFASLVIARLGLRVAALLGADAEAASTHELDLLREAGVDLHVIPMTHGPVFDNVETPGGRVQRALDVADPLRPTAVDVLGGGVAMARGWFLAPVADELPDAWLDAIPPHALVALGWQGMLRAFSVDRTVAKRPPAPSALAQRADLVGLSRDDLLPGTSIVEVAALLSPDATLALTHGADGGIVLGPARGGGRPMRRYSAIAGGPITDATGAGDTFLAALFAARLEPRLIGGRTDRGYDLLLAAAAASLVVEAPGLAGVPTRSAVRDRMREGLAQSARRA